MFANISNNFRKIKNMISFESMVFAFLFQKIIYCKVCVFIFHISIVFRY